MATTSPSEHRNKSGASDSCSDIHDEGPQCHLFSDAVSLLGVSVDTLTHSATNHTLQLAQPLTGDSAKTYRRKEAAAQQTTPQEVVTGTSTQTFIQS